MEDASKALIMAGGILIGIIIITIGVYLFTSFGGTSREIQQQVDSRVIAEFNNNFLKYLGSENCTIHDIVNLTKFTQKVNQEMGYERTDSDKAFYIKVILNGRIDLTQYTEQELINLLSNMQVEFDEQGEAHLPYYKCEQVQFQNPEQSNRVSAIFFRKMT